VEVNEHPKDAVIRELKEELNIDAEFIIDSPFFLSVSETVNEDPSHTDVSLCYLLHGDANKSINFDRKEFEEYAWFAINDIPYEQAAFDLKRFMEKFNEIFNRRQES